MFRPMMAHVWEVAIIFFWEFGWFSECVQILLTKQPEGMRRLYKYALLIGFTGMGIMFLLFRNIQEPNPFALTST